MNGNNMYFDFGTNGMYQQAPQMATASPSASGLSLSAPAYITSTPTQTSVPISNTGRRRSPGSSIDMDAPTKHHSYRTPSATSRKDVPAFMLPHKRLQRQQPSDEEEDELIEEPPAPNATEQEKIEWKRRQNTLAARRSRKRKLQYQQQLELAVERLTVEKEVWKTRALTLRQLLQGHGIPCPDFND